MSATTAKTPYLFYEIWVPRRAPYKLDGEHYWPTIIGNLITPIVDSLNKDDLYWFVQEGKFFQFCIATSRPSYADNLVRDYCKQQGFRVRRLLKGTAGGALGGARWLETRKIGTPAEGERSVRLLRIMHQICELYKEGLVEYNGGWKHEFNSDDQNMHGNHFESLMHLIANVSGAKFDVHLCVRTPWMNWQTAKVVCNV